MRSGVISAIGMVALAVAGPAMADVKSGTDAWQRGDYKAAVEQWRGPAIAGDADAEFNMGQAYKLGRGVPIDPAQAMEWFRKAAAQGHPQAEDNYGLALYQDHKLSDAVPWLEKSVARGEPRAQLVLGTMLFNGDSVPRDYPRAYALMTRAAAQGLSSASETLSQMDQYISPADREKGTALAQRYAAQTGPLAQPVPRPATGPTPPAPGIARVDVPPSHITQPAPPRPTPRPVVTVSAPKQATPARGGWRVQLGAFRDRGNAEALWTRVRTRMAGAEPSYVKAGTVTRLLAGGFATRADAQHACAAAATPCVVVAP